MSRLHTAETFEIYAVVVNTDSVEGKGQDIDLDYFWNREAAAVAAAGADWGGNDAKIQERLVVRLYDESLVLLANRESLPASREQAPMLPCIQVNDLSNNPVLEAKEAQLRKRALAKLTQNEQMLLGVQSEEAGEESDLVGG